MASSLTDEEKIAVFRAMVAGWQDKDWRKCADLLAPDGRLQSMMKEPTVGREAIYQRLVSITSPNKQVILHVHRVGVVGGAVVSERTDEIIIDGVSRSAPVVGVMEFEGPYISHWKEYYDRAQLLHAQGKSE